MAWYERCPFNFSEFVLGSMCLRFTVLRTVSPKHIFAGI